MRSRLNTFVRSTGSVYVEFENIICRSAKDCESIGRTGNAVGMHSFVVPTKTRSNLIFPSHFNGIFQQF